MASDETTTVRKGCNRYNNIIDHNLMIAYTQYSLEVLQKQAYHKFKISEVSKVQIACS